jgi:hypothetical protein
MLSQSQRTEKEHEVATDRWPAAPERPQPGTSAAPFEYGIGDYAEPPPALLIAAGAGTGKTKALSLGSRLPCR